MTFAINSRLLGEGLVVSDAEAAEAVRFAFEVLKLVLEPGGAVALAAVLSGKIAAQGRAIGVIASGGNCDPGALCADPAGRDLKPLPSAQRAPWRVRPRRGTSICSPGLWRMMTMRRFCGASASASRRAPAAGRAGGRGPARRRSGRGGRARRCPRRCGNTSCGGGRVPAAALRLRGASLARSRAAASLAISASWLEERAVSSRFMPAIRPWVSAARSLCGILVEEPAAARGFHHGLADRVEILRPQLTLGPRLADRSLGGIRNSTHTSGRNWPDPCSDRRAHHGRHNRGDW